MKEIIDLLITNGTIVTVNNQRHIIKEGAIAVKGKHIVEVGKATKLNKKYFSEQIINAKGKVVIPGLVDSHVHLSASLIKSLVYGIPIPPGVTYMPFNEALTSDDVYWAAKLSCLERLKTGVTCLVDVGSSNSNLVAKAIVESGQRAVISNPMRDKEIPHFPYSRPLPPDSTTDNAVKKARDFYKKWNGNADNKISVSFSTNIWSTSDDLYIETKKLADECVTSIHDHLDQHRHELEYSLRTWNKRPVEHLDDLGVLGPNFNAHHMVHVGDREIPILQKNQVKICHNPRAALGSHGIPKFPLFVALGLTCTLGTDMRISDMFEVMRLASYMHHGTWGLYYYDPLVLPAENVVEMVTINAAKAILNEKFIGSIEQGKLADITIVDFNKPHLTPSYDIIAELNRHVYGSDVDTVIVDGKILMENRTIKTLNESSILEKTREIGFSTYEKVKESSEMRTRTNLRFNRWKVI